MTKAEIDSIDELVNLKFQGLDFDDFPNFVGQHNFSEQDKDISYQKRQKKLQQIARHKDKFSKPIFLSGRSWATVRLM